MIVRSVDQALGRLRLQGARILVAVSGGIDSSVLLEALRECGSRHDLELCVGHVDHGLRGAASTEDGRFVSERAGALGLPVDVVRVDPQALRAEGSSRLRPSPQEAARQLRYEALHAIARRRACVCVATAHTADDQAETLLLRLLRGVGPDGLGGMPERSPDGALVRPLLDCTRAAVEAFARERGVAWREDASNESDAYPRNRLRRHWLPGLAAEFNPQLLRTLGNLAETCSTDAEWMAQAVAEEAQKRFRSSEDGLAIARSGWSELPQALARRLARSALEQMGAGREVTRSHILRFDAFLGAPASAPCGRSLELPAGLRLVRHARTCLLIPTPVAGQTAC